MKTSRLILSTFLGFTLLGGCSTSDFTYERSYVSADKIQVVESLEQTRISTDAFDATVMKTLSKYYKRHGDGPMDLTISYDPKNHKKGAAWAARQAGDLKTALSKAGVGDVSTRILPVHHAPSTTFIRFASVDALPPEECRDQETPGLHKIGEYGRDYALGCGVKSIFAKQVSRKSDLKGRSGVGSSASERISVRLAALNADPNPQDFISTFVLQEVDSEN